ncbi:transcription factor IIA subunit alpha [Collariella sp. IMI 366227]|nr:transcription factor IIA subunit alpha [Collariella sp. IMI 366227]
MSNPAVGPVYDTIIAEVINAVRVDFEENGVDDGVLEDLKKRWQLKLSQTKVAQFPWDPMPEPQPAAAPNPQVVGPPPSAVPPTANYTQSTLSPQTSAQALSLPGAIHPNHNGMMIKPEPGFVQAEPMIKQESGMPPMHPGYNPGNAARPTAAQRAAQALENQYGQRAAASINAIHSGMASQINQNLPVQQGQRQGPPSQHVNQQQYRQGVAAAMQQRMQQVSHPNGLPSAQHDGPSGDVEAPNPATMDRDAIDMHLHTQLAARARQMEGGGMMLPLKKATKTRGVSGIKGKVDGPAQVDGPDDNIKDEDEYDEDAINSDLDDPDDDREDDEDDDDAMGHMMLCMYDKVQRVKNKWKCILKDGVLTVNGKEYVFHKATGEYEW